MGYHKLKTEVIADNKVLREMVKNLEKEKITLNKIIGSQEKLLELNEKVKISEIKNLEIEKQKELIAGDFNFITLCLEDVNKALSSIQEGRNKISLLNNDTRKKYTSELDELDLELDFDIEDELDLDLDLDELNLNDEDELDLDDI